MIAPASRRDVNRGLPMSIAGRRSHAVPTIAWRSFRKRPLLGLVMAAVVGWGLAKIWNRFWSPCD